MGQKKLLTWIKASETRPAETIIKVPIKILWENGFTYSLGSYNADDDDWWELPNNAIIPDEQIEYLSESLPSSPSGSGEGHETVLVWIENQLSLIAETKYPFGSNYNEIFDKGQKRVLEKVKSLLGASSSDPSSPSIGIGQAEGEDNFRGWLEDEIITSRIDLKKDTINASYYESKLKILYKVKSRYLQSLSAPKPVEQEKKSCYCKDHAEPPCHFGCFAPPDEQSDASKEDEMPEELCEWIGKKADENYYCGSDAPSHVIEENAPLNAVFGEGAECMYKHLQPTYKKAIELLSDQNKDLQLQLSACQAARDEAMNDANVYKELYAKYQKDIATLREQLGKVMEERDSFRQACQSFVDIVDGGEEITQKTYAVMCFRLNKYPKQ